MLNPALKIAQKAGGLLRDNFGTVLKVNESELHDLKLQMDVDCQRLIEKELRYAFPDHSIIGEEESHGDPGAEYRWVVDPLDGTVNYSYGIPHFAVSIGLQKKSGTGPHLAALGGYEFVLGVIYDPMRNEMYSAEKGKGAFLNGHPIRVSNRAALGESIVSIGFAKSDETITSAVHTYQTLIRKVRKIRLMGSAALDLAFVAAGRMEVYSELQVKLWDIAAGAIILEEAGGTVRLSADPKLPQTFKIYAGNGKVNIE